MPRARRVTHAPPWLNFPDTEVALPGVESYACQAMTRQDGPFTRACMHVDSVTNLCQRKLEFKRLKANPQTEVGNLKQNEEQHLDSCATMDSASGS